VDGSPDAPFRATVLAGVPLACAFDLDPGAVDQEAGVVLLIPSGCRDQDESLTGFVQQHLTDRSISLLKMRLPVSLVCPDTLRQAPARGLIAFVAGR